MALEMSNKSSAQAQYLHAVLHMSEKEQSKPICWWDLEFVSFVEW